MQRSIADYRSDDAGDIVAILDCGHGRHLRHRPPMSSRPWVADEAARRARIGTTLDCLKCDRAVLPEDAAPYRATRWFTEETVPGGLLADHTTKRGTWGRLEVESGQLRFIAGPPAAADRHIGPDAPCIIVPEHPHRVELTGAVSFRVVFLRCSPAVAGAPTSALSLPHQPRSADGQPPSQPVHHRKG